MSQIKAVQTEYKGYKFRSRLEARWAVFFDAAGIKWEYEPQGFECKDGTKYLPDFYLPEERMWCEVKPNNPERAKEFEKVFACIKECSEIERLLILPEIPKDDARVPMYWFLAAYYNPMDECVSLRRVFFNVGDSGDIYLQTNFAVARESEISEWTFLDRFNCGSGWCAIHDYKMPCKDEFFYCDYISNEDINILRKAYKSARQARFEYGETPY